MRYPRVMEELSWSWACIGPTGSRDAVEMIICVCVHSMPLEMKVKYPKVRVVHAEALKKALTAKSGARQPGDPGGLRGGPGS